MTDWIQNPWPRVFCHRPLHGLRSPCRVAPVLPSRPYITRSGFSFEVIQCEKGSPLGDRTSTASVPIPLIWEYEAFKIAEML